MTRLHRIVALLGAAVLALTTVAVSSPAHAGGRKWPGGRITYFDATKDKDAVAAAVGLWNRSGVNVHFRKIRNRKRADVLIRNTHNVPMGCGSGYGTLGYLGGRQGYVNILHGSAKDGQTCAWPGQTIVLVHELGHVLGLGHIDSRCSIMNSSHTNGVAPTRCLGRDPDDARPGRWWCRGPEQKDLAVVRKIYGGKAKAVRADPWCDAVPRIPATGPVTTTVDEWGDLDISVVHLAEPALPAWVGTWGWGGPGVEVHLTPAACTAVPGDESTQVYAGRWNVPVGGIETFAIMEPTVPGTYCVSAWAFDQTDGHALAPSTAMVTLAPQPYVRTPQPWTDTTRPTQRPTGARATEIRLQ